MTTIASQITSLMVVYSTVYSDADQRKHQSSASLAFVWGIHWNRWIPRTKSQLRGKCLHLMTSSWQPVRAHLTEKNICIMKRVCYQIASFVLSLFYVLYILLNKRSPVWVYDPGNHLTPPLQLRRVHSVWPSDVIWLHRSGPVFCPLLRVSSGCARPITGQVTSVTWPVIGWV